MGSIAGLCVALIGVMSGTVNALGWSTVVIYGGLLVGYASILRASVPSPIATTRA